MTSDLNVFGLNKDCQVDPSVNTSISGHPSSDYALAGISRLSESAAEIFLVKKLDREVVKVHFSTTGAPQTFDVLPKMQPALSRTDTSYKYAMQRQGNQLTLISFEDNLALAGSINAGYNKSMETSRHRIDTATKTMDSSWGI